MTLAEFSVYLHTFPPVIPSGYPNVRCWKEKWIKLILRLLSILVSLFQLLLVLVTAQDIQAMWYLHHCSRCCICSTISLQISSRSCISNCNFSCRSFTSSAFMASTTCSSSWMGTSRSETHMLVPTNNRAIWKAEGGRSCHQTAGPKFLSLTSLLYLEISTSFSLSSSRLGSNFTPVSKVEEARKLCSLMNECKDGNPRCTGGACTS